MSFNNNTAYANLFFQAIQSQTGIISAMDNLVVNFDISSITQSWISFSCNTNNGTFTVAQ